MGFRNTELRKRSAPALVVDGGRGNLVRGATGLFADRRRFSMNRGRVKCNVMRARPSVVGSVALEDLRVYTHIYVYIRYIHIMSTSLSRIFRYNEIPLKLPLNSTDVLLSVIRRKINRIFIFLLSPVNRFAILRVGIENCAVYSVLR